MGWTLALLVGLGLVLLAVVLGIREHGWIKHAAIGDGVVVEFVASRGGSGGRTTYCPRVTFAAADGSQHTFTRQLASNPPDYAVGEAVKVAYDPATQEGRIRSFGERFGVPVFMAAIGLGAVMTSATFLIGKRVFDRVYLR